MYLCHPSLTLYLLVFVFTINTAVRCPEIEPPKYGSVSVRGYIFESKVYYTCNHGYELHGLKESEYRKCDYTGTWSGTAPVCKRKTTK